MRRATWVFPLAPSSLFLLIGLSWFAKILIYLHLIVPKDMNTFVFEIVVNLCEEGEFGIGFLHVFWNEVDTLSCSLCRIYLPTVVLLLFRYCKRI